MKKILVFTSVFLFIFLLGGCGQKSNKKQQGTENAGEEVSISGGDQKAGELKAEDPSVNTTGQMTPKPAETKEVVARFVKFSPSTSGSIFIFEDQNGEEHWFHKAPNAEGMDFATELDPGAEPERYENIWFNVVVENREVERTGEKRKEWTILRLEETDIPDAKKQKKIAFTADDLKNAVFFGTEPFWSMHFKDDHLLKSSPTGEVKFLYLKDGVAGNYQLKDVIIPVSPVVTEVQVTDEDMGAMATIMIIRETCSDGMSDNDYPFTFSMKWKEDGGGWNGCGRIDD